MTTMKNREKCLPVEKYKLKNIVLAERWRVYAESKESSLYMFKGKKVFIHSKIKTKNKIAQLFRTRGLFFLLSLFFIWLFKFWGMGFLVSYINFHFMINFMVCLNLVGLFGDYRATLCEGVSYGITVRFWD